MNYFYINTNESNAPGQYSVWLYNNKAFVHGEKWGKELDKLSPGDICLMYIDKQGVKAVGEVLKYRDRAPYREHMIRRKERLNSNEYRIDIDWYLVRPKPVSPVELKTEYGLKSWRGTVRPIKKNKDKASELVQQLEEEHALFPEEINENEVAEAYREGNLRYTTVNAHERNSKARRACIRHHGCSCVVCKFNFEATYGEVGKDFIHVHHIKPLSQIEGEYEVDPVEDLRPVCPNCHAVIHREKRTLAIEEVRRLIELTKAKTEEV